MNEFDPLEAELAALHPQKPSAELKQRIAEELSLAVPAYSKSRRRSVRWIAAFAGGVIATAVVLVLWRGGDKAIAPDEPAIPLPQTAAAFDESLPSLWSYRTALAQSPEAVEALLDRHAAGNSESKPGRARVYFFARYDSELNPLAGEL